MHLFLGENLPPQRLPRILSSPRISLRNTSREQNVPSYGIHTFHNLHGEGYSNIWGDRVFGVSTWVKPGGYSLIRAESDVPPRWVFGQKIPKSGSNFTKIPGKSGLFPIIRAAHP